MNTTPKKLSNFSPIILQTSPAAVSPQKNLTGPPRVARDITADLYNNIQRWNDLHITGAKIVKQIAILKGENPNDFSHQLEEYVNQLYGIVQNLAVYCNCFDNLTTQIRALSKLNGEKLFISLDVKILVTLIEEISNAYKEEFKVKQQVLENISYSKCKSDVMFHASCWTYQCFITNEIKFKLETLLIETGHRKFN